MWLLLCRWDDDIKLERSCFIECPPWTFTNGGGGGGDSSENSSGSRRKAGSGDGDNSDRIPNHPEVDGCL